MPWQEVVTGTDSEVRLRGFQFQLDHPCDLATLVRKVSQPFFLTLWFLICEMGMLRVALEQVVCSLTE